TGIFTVTGLAAAQYSGPALIISIVISAISVGLTALFYAEFDSRIPTNGGAYGYLYSVIGELPAWIAGWLTLMQFFT
ncbi:amino acid permease, partial [Streptococcus suis]